VFACRHNPPPPVSVAAYPSWRVYSRIYAWKHILITVIHRCVPLLLEYFRPAIFIFHEIGNIRWDVHFHWIVLQQSVG
jgi:hypothetical protein